jgi:YhcG PDDEXK nuclease domain
MGKLTHEDIEQMLFYTGWYEEEEMRDGENPPVGLILCTDKNDAVVRYTLSKSTQQIFASRYKLYLLTEEELRTELQRERERIEQERRLSGASHTSDTA